MKFIIDEKEEARIEAVDAYIYYEEQSKEILIEKPISGNFLF